MKKGSVITIILLILVIIGLTIALVVTNLPKKENVGTDINIENNDNNVKENITKDEEKPTEVSLEGEQVDKFYNFLEELDSLYNVESKTITAKEIDSRNIQAIAYLTYIKGNEENIDYQIVKDYRVSGKYSEEKMNEAVKKAFGDIEYNHSNFGSKNGMPLGVYVEEEKMYYLTDGYGGNVGYYSYPIKGITKIEEYTNRYEVYEEYLYVKSNNSSTGTDYVLTGLDSKELFRFDDTNKQLEESVSDINPENIYVGKVEYTDYELIKMNTFKNVLTKYKEDATMYKHTFMKNDDGSFYWSKSEIVK